MNVCDNKGKPLNSRSFRPCKCAAQRRSGFTLIELLAVMAIISVLASLIVGVASLAKQKARIAKAEADIELIKNTLEDYKIDNGAYPDSLMDIVEELPESVGTEDTSDGAIGNPEDRVKDPWNRTYVYEVRNENSYTLYSEGPDPNISADNIPR